MVFSASRRKSPNVHDCYQFRFANNCHTLFSSFLNYARFLPPMSNNTGFAVACASRKQDGIEKGRKRRNRRLESEFGWIPVSTDAGSYLPTSLPLFSTPFPSRTNDGATRALESESGSCTRIFSRKTTGRDTKSLLFLSRKV